MQNKWSLVKMSIYLYSSTIFISVWLIYRYHSETFENQGFTKHYFLGKVPLFSQFLLGIAVALFVVFLCILGRKYSTVVRNTETELKNALENLNFREILIVSFLSGVGEEIFFRGLLQPYLGILWTSVIFGVLHSPPNKKLFFYPIFATIMSFVLGFMTTIHGGSITSAIVAHVLINAINLHRLGDVTPQVH